MKNNQYKFFIISIYTIAILFLTLYFILSFHSRIAGDDFFYLWLKNKFGAWDGMMYQYNAWSGRWAAHSLGCLMISQWKNPLFLPFINFLSLTLLYFSLKGVFDKITTLIQSPVDRKLIPAFILILITTFFFTSYSIGETWFWYIIILTYLWSIIAFLFLLNNIFSEKKGTGDFILIFLCSSFIGGASESYALIFLSSLSFLFIYRWKILKAELNDAINRRLLFAIVILAVSFSFSAFAPGTAIRHSLLPHTPLIAKTWIATKAFSKFFIRFLPQKIIYIILFSWPWIFFGSICLKTKFNPDKTKILIKNISVIFIVSIAAMLIPTTFVMSETGPDRALSVISIASSIYFAILFSLIGIFIDHAKIQYRIIQYGLFALSIFVLAYNIYSQYLITEKFTKAYSERLNIIQKAKENNFAGVLELPKMPPEGMLYWDEISEDTSYYSNMHLKDGLNLPFRLKLGNQ